jgi:DNA end-binding protein Ku
MARTIWNGAISYGLLHAPVALHSATKSDDIDFDWLKRGSLQPVGYKRVVKETGKEVDADDIVKGIKQDDGTYVIFSDEEIKSANVKATHTIDIVAFSEAKDISFLYFETPYFIEPIKGGEKVYALLREALLKTEKIGIAYVVLHNKQHLAALIPTAKAIVLNTLRWDIEVKDGSDLDLPPTGLKAPSISPKELTMATQLIESMTEPWKPSQYKDTFRDDILALAKKKVKEGKAQTITDVKVRAPKVESVSGKDLLALLKQSIEAKPKPQKRKPIVARKKMPAAKSGTRMSKQVSKALS